MAKKLESNGLFDSSRMMLPQHKEAILRRQFETNNMHEKPIIDEQEWQLIGQVLQESFLQHVRVRIKLFDPYEDKEISGFVTVINTYLKEIKLRNEDDWDWVKFENILSARV